MKDAPADAVPRRAAIFDLDRTITRFGTFTRFLISARPGVLSRIALLFQVVPQMLYYKAGGISRKTLKNRMMKIALAGKSHSDIAALAEEFVARIMETGLRREALETIERHRAAGEKLALATASVDFLAEKFCHRLNLDLCIATRTNFNEGADQPPEIVGENCYGDAKLTMVKERISSLRATPDEDIQISFYTDHISDFELLKVVDEAYVINPNTKLRAHAENAGWTILDWSARANPS